MKKIIAPVVAFAAFYGICLIILHLDSNNIWATTFVAIISMVWTVAKQIVSMVFNIVIN